MSIMAEDFKQNLTTLSALLGFSGAVAITSVPVDNKPPPMQLVKQHGAFSQICNAKDNKDCLLIARYISNGKPKTDPIITIIFNKNAPLPKLRINLPKAHLNTKRDIILMTEHGQMWPNNRSINDVFDDFWYRGGELKSQSYGFPLICNNGGVERCWTEPNFTEEQWDTLKNSSELMVQWGIRGSQLDRGDKISALSLDLSLDGLRSGLKALGYNPTPPKAP